MSNQRTESTMNHRMIEIIAADSDKRFEAYLSLPRSGRGPGLVLAQEIFGVNSTMRELADYYAEEGYVVLVPDLFWRQSPGVQLGYSPEVWQKAFEFYKGFDEALGVSDIQASINALRALPECEGGVGVVGYCLGGKLAYLAACRTDCDAAVSYYGAGIEAALEEARKISKPTCLHIAEMDQFCPPAAREAIVQKMLEHENVQTYVYAGVDHAFARVGGEHFHKASSMMAHQRSMELLKQAIGPRYNLSALWDKHCEYEFATRDVDATMATMVEHPYVNHVPTMTGGVGYRDLHHFYTNFFVASNPPDTSLVPISRTVGATQIVDEMLFSFTHTCEVPWMLPGVAPTGKKVEIPLVAIIKFRGDKLYHEHIYWDQASVLVQIGLISDEFLPVAGVATQRKLIDENLPSNSLMKRRGQK
jgi:carboxymethylenebutenolidase